ncbi:hypothetical protein HID58_085563, partial [Brassica napus]
YKSLKRGETLSLEKSSNFSLRSQARIVIPADGVGFHSHRRSGFLLISPCMLLQIHRHRLMTSEVEAFYALCFRLVFFYPMKTKLFDVNLLSSIDGLVLQMRSQPNLADALRLKWLRR